MAFKSPIDKPSLLPERQASPPKPAGKAEPQHRSERPLSPKDAERTREHKEMARLEARSASLAPEEREQLGVLRAKRNESLERQMQRAEVLGHNPEKIFGRQPKRDNAAPVAPEAETADGRTLPTPSPPIVSGTPPQPLLQRAKVNLPTIETLEKPLSQGGYRTIDGKLRLPGAAKDGRNDAGLGTDIGLKTQVQWGPLDADKMDGTSMRAAPLGPDHKKGSEPAGAGLWVNKRKELTRASGGHKYIAGHLLNAELGGPGNNPHNLTAIPDEINKQHSQGIEEHVKREVNADHRWGVYAVTTDHAYDSVAKVRYANKLTASWQPVGIEGNKLSYAKGKQLVLTLNIPSPSSFKSKTADTSNTPAVEQVRGLGPEQISTPLAFNQLVLTSNTSKISRAGYANVLLINALKEDGSTDAQLIAELERRFKEETAALELELNSLIFDGILTQEHIDWLEFQLADHEQAVDELQQELSREKNILGQEKFATSIEQGRLREITSQITNTKQTISTRSQDIQKLQAIISKPSLVLDPPPPVFRQPSPIWNFPQQNFDQNQQSSSPIFPQQLLPFPQILSFLQQDPVLQQNSSPQTSISHDVPSTTFTHPNPTKVNLPDIETLEKPLSQGVGRTSDGKLKLPLAAKNGRSDQGLGTDQALKTVVNWGSLAGDKMDGTSMEAFPLGPDHKKGSAPASTGLWVNKRRQLSKAAGGHKYIAGHLLNAELGGPGNNPHNLTAIPEEINKQHSQRIEEHVKAEVNVHHNWGIYTVITNHAYDAIAKVHYADKLTATWKPIADLGLNGTLNYASGKQVTLTLNIPAPSSFAGQTADTSNLPAVEELKDFGKQQLSTPLAFNQLPLTSATSAISKVGLTNVLLIFHLMKNQEANRELIETAKNNLEQKKAEIQEQISETLKENEQLEERIQEIEEQLRVYNQAIFDLRDEIEQTKGEILSEKSEQIYLDVIAIPDQMKVLKGLEQKLGELQQAVFYLQGEARQAVEREKTNRSRTTSFFTFSGQQDRPRLQFSPSDVQSSFRQDASGMIRTQQELRVNTGDSIQIGFRRATVIAVNSFLNTTSIDFRYD